MASDESIVPGMYPLHTAVAEALRGEFGEQFGSFWAEECGGDVKNGLFCSEAKGAGARFVMPDILFLLHEEIKVLIEVEEDGKAASPTHLFGKWCAAAMSRCFIHERKGNRPIPFHRNATLVQVCDTTAVLKQSRTSKLQQWLNIETSIRASLPFGSITYYRLLWGNIYDFGYHGTKREWLVDTVSEALNR